MRDASPEPPPTASEQTKPGQKPSRTHSHSVASMAFTLTWTSENVRHRDCIAANNLNLWRDTLPARMGSDLQNKPVGHVASQEFRAGELVSAYREQDCREIRPQDFTRNLGKVYVEPKAGRFYPRRLIGGVKSIFAEELTPFRITNVHAGALRVDLNHPLAGLPLSLEARILDIRAARDEHSSAVQDIIEIVAMNGPGMQARWRGQPTDFMSDNPFDRFDPSPDEVFYAKPRLVYHLDSTALNQIRGLYRRLLPRGAEILDLMTSWTSHIDTDLEPAAVTGVGLNEEELQANGLLSTRLTHDLNLDPRLPLPDQAFDAAICTVSVEYLTKPAEVFSEVRRVLRPGGRFVVAFSNRWFPSKVVKVWQNVHEFERVGLVLEYFLRDGGYSNLETWSMRGLPRPADDKYSDRLAQSDPLYAVWGERTS